MRRVRLPGDYFVVRERTVCAFTAVFGLQYNITTVPRRGRIVRDLSVGDRSEFYRRSVVRLERRVLTNKTSRPMVLRLIRETIESVFSFFSRKTE